MRLLTFDQSISRTGWAFWSLPGREADIETGSFSCSEPIDDSDKLDLFAREVRKLRTRFKPTFIGWEQASRRISMFTKHGDDEVEEGQPRLTPNAKQLLLPEAQGVLRGIATAYMIDHEGVPTNTWRAKIFKGGGGYTREEAKRAALTTCKYLGITAANHDAAEAACLCLWFSRCSQKFKMVSWRLEVEAQASQPTA